MHLGLELKPLIFIEKILKLPITVVTPGACQLKHTLPHPSCTAPRAQHRRLMTWAFQHDPAWLLDLMLAGSGLLFIALICQTAVNTLGTIKQCHQDYSTRVMPKSIKIHSKTRNVLLTTKSRTTWQTVTFLSMDSRLSARLAPTLHTSQSHKANLFISLKSDYSVMQSKERPFAFFFWYLGNLGGLCGR